MRTPSLRHITCPAQAPLRPSLPSTPPGLAVAPVRSRRAALLHTRPPHLHSTPQHTCAHQGCREEAPVLSCLQSVTCSSPARQGTPLWLKHNKARSVVFPSHWRQTTTRRSVKTGFFCCFFFKPGHYRPRHKQGRTRRLICKHLHPHARKA